MDDKVSRRDLLHWTLVTGALVPLGVNTICGAIFSSRTEAQSLSPAIPDTTVESWMNELMYTSKAPKGMLRLSRFSEPIYFLTAPISWIPNPGQDAYQTVTVPKGFVTDFASIPRVFWSVLPPDGKYAYAAVIHDYLYWTQERTREEADQILKMAMQDFKVGEVTINSIYTAVRVGGGFAWSGNAEKKARGEKRILSRWPQDPTTKYTDWIKRPGVQK